MEFKLHFNMDNASFNDSPEYGINSILTETCHKVIEGETEGIIKDINGNTIGRWKIETV